MIEKFSGMDSTSVMAIFSALALGHSLFLVHYFWTSVAKSPSNFFLSLVLSALILRILKSVIVILIPNSPFAVPAIGLVGLSAIGPSLWLYLKAYKHIDFVFQKKHLWHYAWAMWLVLAIPFLNEDQMYIAYCISVAHMLFYLVLSLARWIKNRSGYDEIQSKWLKLLLGSTFLIWLTFFAQLLVESFGTYLSVTVVASTLVYGLSLWAGKKRKLFMEPKQKPDKVVLRHLEHLGRTIEGLFTERLLFKDSKLNIKKISDMVSEPEYIVSRSINTYFRKSFPEVVNHYRIEHAAQLIRSDAFKHLSMEGIAKESGYNTVSAFYKTFKKLKGVTPAKFKH